MCLILLANPKATFPTTPKPVSATVHNGAMPAEVPATYDESCPQTWPPASLEQKLAVLRVACASYSLPGQLEAEIRKRYHIGPARFWQLVNRLITEKEVLAAQPVQCYRLARLRNTRKEARANLLNRPDTLGA